MSEKDYIGDIVMLPTANDILTLTRVIQDLQFKLQKTAADLEQAKEDAEQYRNWWLEERRNIEKLARIGDKLRRVDPMAPCPIIDEWDMACIEFKVEAKENDDA